MSEDTVSCTPSGLLTRVVTRFSQVVRVADRPPSCCGGRLPTGRFPFVASRNAVSGDGPRRRSSNGRLFVYRSTIRPVRHPPSVERTKDLSHEKKLRPHALRSISRESDESAGRIVGRDQRLPNGDSNRARKGEAANEECKRHPRGVPQWLTGPPWRNSHRQCDQGLKAVGSCDGHARPQPKLRRATGAGPGA